MGRPRKPVAQRVLDGTYRADRHGPLPDDADGSPPPEKPDGMNPVAAEFWDQIVRLKAAVVRDCDGPQLVQLCSWWALWLEAEQSLQNYEIGTLNYNRTLIAVSASSQNFDRIAKRFGLTPADRAVLKAERSSGPAKPKVATRPKTSLDAKGAPKKGKK